MSPAASHLGTCVRERGARGARWARRGAGEGAVAPGACRGGHGARRAAGDPARGGRRCGAGQAPPRGAAAVHSPILAVRAWLAKRSVGFLVLDPKNDVKPATMRVQPPSAAQGEGQGMGEAAVVGRARGAAAARTVARARAPRAAPLEHTRPLGTRGRGAPRPPWKITHLSPGRPGRPAAGPLRGRGAPSRAPRPLPAAGA
jgi:hypothetical protein